MASWNSVKFHLFHGLPWHPWLHGHHIRWIPWKWSQIAPWIPQKLSVESMETYRKRTKLMPLNFPLNFHCFLEVHGNGVRILLGSGSGIHGYPWKSQRRESFIKCMYYHMYTTNCTYCICNNCIEFESIYM